MILEAAVLLHGGHGQVLLSDYLYRVGLYLLVFAVIAVVTHWWLGMVGRRESERNGKERES